MPEHCTSCYLLSPHRNKITMLTASVYGMQDSLRAAGSHLYRLAPLLLELARAFSGAVAAMQGQAGPLALNPSSYIRSDGQSVVHLLPFLLPCATLGTSELSAPSHLHRLALLLCGVVQQETKSASHTPKNAL